MKNLLILIVAIALYLHFYPQPEVTKFYQDKKAMALDAFAEFSDTQVRLDTNKVLIDLEPHLKVFSKKELKHLDIILSDRKNVRAFYYDYCKAKKRDRKFSQRNQGTTCSAIGKYAKYLRKKN